MTMRTSIPVGGLALVSLALLAPQAHAASSPVSIEAVSVTPQKPGPGVLCTLGVRLKNSGTHIATDFRFSVKIDGQDVATYKVESFAQNVAPGASDTIALHNFWTPTAPKASVTVEVSVLEGRWADVKQEGNTSTTTPVGPIEGLPVSATQSVQMGSGK
jgi:hypothetical protein